MVYETDFIMDRILNDLSLPVDLTLSYWISSMAHQFTYCSSEYYNWNVVNSFYFD